MKETDEIATPTDTRRKFVFGISLLSLLPLTMLGRFFGNKKEVISCAPPSEKKTVKMLTQDGKLVEVEVSNLASNNKQKISKEELMAWVKK